MKGAVSEIDFEGAGKLPVANIVFNHSSRAFTLTSGEKETYQCTVPYGHDEGKDPPGDGLVLLLFNPLHFESDVRRIRISSLGTTTVGWLCTVSALTSEGHKYWESRHFRNAAFVATSLLLKSGPYSNRSSIRNGANISLDDLLEADASVLILHRKTISPVLQDDLGDLLPSLHQFGFVPYTGANSLTWKPGRITASYFTDASENLTLTPLPASTRCGEFIRNVFAESIPTAQSDILKFFFYYQVIECLLESVFTDRQSDAIFRMAAVRENRVLVHHYVDKLREDTSVKRLVHLLFNDYSGVEANLGDLLVACNSVARCFEGKENTTAAESFYEVRNLIFHNLRRMKQSTQPLLKTVVDQLEWAVPELLLNFRFASRSEDFAI